MKSLNPYCSWTWTSTTDMTGEMNALNFVLILIVVGRGLVRSSDFLHCTSCSTVLILIVVGRGLVQSKRSTADKSINVCLNPCCSWTWTSTNMYHISIYTEGVLILVVVGRGLVLSLVWDWMKDDLLS